MHSLAAAVIAMTLSSGLVRADSAAGGTLSQAAEAAGWDLDESRRQLALLRETIQAEKLPLTRELSRLEADLAKLRHDQEAAARGQDTTALETGNLREALKLHEEEAVYLSNLMAEYARGFESTLHVSELPRLAGAAQTAILASQNKDLSAVQKLTAQFDVLETSLDRLERLVGGERFDGEAVDPRGTISQGRFALIGPVALFASKGGETAGLALPQTGSTKPVVRPLDEVMAAGLVPILATGEGILPLDPTRGGALQELMKRGSLMGYFKKGGPIMWPLLLVSILATTVIIERLFFLARERRRRDPEALQELLGKVGTGDLEGATEVGRRSDDFVVRALTYALEHRERSLTSALMRSSSLELVRFTRGISILDTCVTMAPLLGLLGTVTGMMGSFGMLGGAELGAPAQITGGIAEALIATCFGLGIAVTALIPMNYLHSRSDQARHEMEDASTHIELLMKPVLDLETVGVRERRIGVLARDASQGSHLPQGPSPVAGEPIARTA